MNSCFVLLVLLTVALLRSSEASPTLPPNCGCSTLKTRRAAADGSESGDALTQVDDMVFGKKDRFRFSTNVKKFRMGTNM